MSYTDQDFEKTAASHTPGPWRTVVNCQDYEARPYFVYAGAKCIAAIERNDDPACTHEPDAALIAAAPDLLAALKALHHQCDYMGAPATHPDMAAAVAAIAKATGRPE